MMSPTFLPRASSRSLLRDTPSAALLAQYQAGGAAPDSPASESRDSVCADSPALPLPQLAPPFQTESPLSGAARYSRGPQADGLPPDGASTSAGAHAAAVTRIPPAAPATVDTMDQAIVSWTFDAFSFAADLEYPLATLVGHCRLTPG